MGARNNNTLHYAKNTVREIPGFLYFTLREPLWAKPTMMLCDMQVESM